MSARSEGPAKGRGNLISRRSLAAIGATAAAPLLLAATDDALLRPEQFHAPRDGHHSDSVALQKMLDRIARSDPPSGTIRMDSGHVLIDTPIHLPDSAELDFGRARVTLQPTAGYAIGIGWDPASPMAGNCTIRGRWLELHGRGRTAIAIRNGSGAQIIETDIALRDSDQTGLRITANDKPLGPYCGLVSNFRIYGDGSPGQQGIVLEQKPARGAICVNRWLFSDIRHIASVEIGLDIRGADGLAFTNINFESCSRRAVRFGFGNRRIEGEITAGAGTAGGFLANALVGMELDATGSIQILSGPNRGESMPIVTIDRKTGAVVFPANFPANFAVGDRFVFTECKCRSVTISNATNEGGSNDEEVGFEFLAGAQSCRVTLAMTTMGAGFYFVREVEDQSNTIARRMETMSFDATLDAGDGVVVIPAGGASNRGGRLTAEQCWVDAIYATADNDSGGTIDIEVLADGINQQLRARLTPASPYSARRIRKRLPVGQMIGPGRHIKVQATKRGLRKAQTVKIDVVLGFL